MGNFSPTRYDEGFNGDKSMHSFHINITIEDTSTEMRHISHRLQHGRKVSLPFDAHAAIEALVTRANFFEGLKCII